MINMSIIQLNNLIKPELMPLPWDLMFLVYSVRFIKYCLNDLRKEVYKGANSYINT
jgi:hypothetical protein